jgi:hypothetical protein
MTLTPIEELTDRQWYDAYMTVYDRDLAFEIGTDPRLVMNPPTLVQFYENIMAAVNAGTFKAWAILDGDRYRGHTILDKSGGEWEVGTVIPLDADRSTGAGVRATLHALRWAFLEDESEWVTAFVNHPNTDQVRDFLIRGGFRKFMHFYVMDRSAWETRWGREDDNG